MLDISLRHYLPIATGSQPVLNFLPWSENDLKPRRNCMLGKHY